MNKEKICKYNIDNCHACVDKGEDKKGILCRHGSVNCPVDDAWRTGRGLPESGEIPDWCPLPDASKQENLDELLSGITEENQHEDPWGDSEPSQVDEVLECPDVIGGVERPDEFKCFQSEDDQIFLAILQLIGLHKEKAFLGEMTVGELRGMTVEEKKECLLKAREELGIKPILKDWI